MDESLISITSDKFLAISSYCGIIPHSHIKQQTEALVNTKLSGKSVVGYTLSSSRFQTQFVSVSLIALEEIKACFGYLKMKR